MDVPVNYLAVLVAAVAVWGIGWVWYGPLFGKQWARWTGMSPDRAKKHMKPMVSMLLGLGTMYLVALVLSHLITLLGSETWEAAKQVAFWVWLGFFVPLTAGAWLWEGRPFRLFLVNAIYWLIALDVAAYILVSWM